jgi:tRNA pseudouridine55 synthase
MDGILVVNKPLGKTSFDMVAQTRREFHTKKVGHIGTLDPMASGVLPILIGSCTKLSDYLMDHDKDYVAIIKLGKSTNTGDQEGEIVEEAEVDKSILEETKVEEALNSFVGESEQIPPMYSAIKINGKKLYELARAGQTVERKPRKIYISNIELLNIGKEENEIKFKVTCSKGTYIRTLCEDIAKKLGTIGYMTELTRTRVGEFNIEDEGKVISLEELLSKNPSKELDDNEYRKLSNGIMLEFDETANDEISSNLDCFVKLYHNKEFIGVAKIEKNNKIQRFILKENEKGEE